MDIIDESHPSFGTGQAWFQFAISSPDGAVRKILLVEAKNSRAVYTIERILLKDGKASSFCTVTAVFRQCPGIGLRSDIIAEISYVDFLIDVVDPSKLLEDVVVATAFRTSLTDEEAAYASRKIKAMNAEPEEEPEVEDDDEDEPAPVDSRELISTSLVRMGFKKPAVDKFIRAQGKEFFSSPVAVQLKAALAALAP